jgi:hypothetical protein
MPCVRRLSHSAIATAMTAAIVAGVVTGTAAPADAQTNAQVMPFVSCVEFLPQRNLRAHFGYVSTFATEVTLPIGIDNFMSPGIINRGQPQTFLPGFQDRVFSIDFHVAPSLFRLSWILQNSLDTAATAPENPGLLCAVRSRGEWDAQATYDLGDLVRDSGSLFVRYGYLDEGFCTGPPASVPHCWYPYTPSPPVISEIPDQTLAAAIAFQVIPFTVSDADSVWNLTVLATSSNPQLLPIDRITFDGYGANHSVTVMPIKHRSGSAVVTLFVTDGISVARESFTVTVLP